MINILSLLLLLSLSLSVDIIPSQVYYGSEDSFHLTIEDPTKVTSLSFELTCFSGSCDIPSIYTDEAMTTPVTVSSSSARRKTILTLSSDFVANYYFKSTCIDDCYFELVALANRPGRVIQKGFTNVEGITKEDKQVSFTIPKVEPTENSTPLILSINAINCLTDVTIGEKTTPKTKHVQYQVDDTTVDFSFTVQVSEMDDLNEKSEVCSILIDAVEDNPDEKFFTLTEGVSQMFELNESTEKINLRYVNVNGPASFDIDYTSLDGLELNVFKKDMTTPIKTATIYKKKTFMIDSTELNDVIISIKKKESGPAKVAFSVIFKSNKGYPTYFQREKVVYGYLFPQQTSYYYTDIKMKEPGKLILNYRQGGGKICVRVMPKGEIDEKANWMHNVDLSQGCLKEQVDITGYITLVQLHNADTEKCENGCELIVTLTNQEEAKGDNKNYLDEFTLYYNVRESEKKLEVPLNENINLEQEKINIEDQLVQVPIPYDTSRLLISYDSLLFRMYLNKDKETYPTEDDYEYEYIENGNYAIEEKSLKGKTLKVHFTSRDAPQDESFYYFKVSPQYQNTPDILYTTSGKIDKCKINKEGDSCYFLVPIKDYEFLSTISIGAFTEQKDTITLLAKLYPAEKIDAIKYTEEGMNALLPTEESADAKGENYVVIPSEKIEKDTDMYMIVKATSAKTGEIIFAVSSNQNSKKPFLYYQTNPKMIVVPKGETFSFDAYMRRPEQKVEVFELYGKGKYEKGDSGLITVTLTASEDQDYVVIIRWEKKVNESLERKEYKKLNTFTITKLPYYTYVLLDQATVSSNQDINTKIKFFNIQYTQEKEEGDTFTVFATLVDSHSIKEFECDSAKKPEEPEQCYYFNNEKVATSKKTTEGNSKRYLFIEIQGSQGNENDYKEVSLHLLTVPITEKVPETPLPQKEYYVDVLSTKDTVNKMIYKLSKSADTDNQILVNLGLVDKDNKFDYIVETVKDTPTGQNETAIIKEQSNYNGIRTLLLTATDSVLLIVSPKQQTNDDQSIVKIFLKYQSGEEGKIPSFQYNRNMTIVQSNSTCEFNITADNIIKGHEEFKSIVYSFKVYNKSRIDDVSKIDNIFEDSELPETFKEVTLDSKEENFFLQVNTTNFPKEMYFTLSATFDEYKFGFDFVNVTNTEETKDEGFDWWLLGIVFVAILVIGIIVAGIIFLYKKEQRNKLTQLAKREDLLE